MQPEITLKIPEAQEQVLRKLYAILDVLQTNNTTAARIHCNDCLVYVQNELDWTYRTDPVLPFIREFLLELKAAILLVDQNKELLTSVLQIIRSTMNEVIQASSGLARWNAPDVFLDDLEIAHRKNLYSNKE